ncbi:MAG TPA: hypothetical protein VF601_16965 [Beijerinckiaceae bacterium]|jgi:hypothetical protein
MKTATAGVTARHSHLIRAAQCAGEAFACSPGEERRRTRPHALALWLGLGAFAALALLVAF